MGRDGGIQIFELLGLITLHVGNEKWGRIRVQLENHDTRGVQLQTHPNVDKELFKMKSQVFISIHYCASIKILLSSFLNVFRLV